MRIDGFSPAYVPNRTTRPDASSYSDAIVRQGEANAHQPESQRDSIQPQTRQALRQLEQQAEYQSYQERNQAPEQSVSYQNRHAIASYGITASFGDTSAADATTVLGLDIYA